MNKLKDLSPTAYSDKEKNALPLPANRPIINANIKYIEIEASAMCHFSKPYSLSIKRKNKMPANCIKIQNIIHANENGTPNTNGSSLFPKLYIGKIINNNIMKLNRKKYKSNFFLLFIF